MFIIRIKNIRIKDNFSRKKLFGKRRDRGEVQILAFAATEATEMPNLGGLLETTVEAEQAAILRGAVDHFVQNAFVREFPGIPDGHEFEFGSAGREIFSSEKMPDKVQISVMLIEKDQKERSDAARLEATAQNPTVLDAAKKLAPAFKTAFGIGAKAIGGPVFLAASALGPLVLRAFFTMKKKNRDDLVGAFETTLVRGDNFSEAKTELLDEGDASGNMRIDFSIFWRDDSEAKAFEAERARVKTDAPPA